MSHVNHITWEWAGTCDDSGLPDMNGDSDALPRAWWAQRRDGARQQHLNTPWWPLGASFRGRAVTMFPFW